MGGQSPQPVLNWPIGSGPGWPVRGSQTGQSSRLVQNIHVTRKPGIIPNLGLSSSKLEFQVWNLNPRIVIGFVLFKPRIDAILGL